MSDYQHFYGTPQSDAAPAQAFGPPQLGPHGQGAFAHFGNYFSLGFQALGNRWRDWVGPMLVAALIWMLAWLPCGIPLLFVAGPVTAGLYACALCTLRGQPMDTGTLHRGWERFGSTFATVLVVWLLNLAASVVVVGLWIGTIALALAATGALHAPRPGRGGEPDAAFIVVFVLLFYGGLFVAVILLMLWQLWIGTRTMFMLPLIIDRGLTFSEAWSASWDLTRRHFWELLVLRFLAGLLGSLGINLCYVGVLATLPIYYSLIAAAYEIHFTYPEQQTGEAASGPLIPNP